MSLPPSHPAHGLMTEEEAERRLRNACRSMLAVSVFLTVPGVGLLYIAIQTDKSIWPSVFVILAAAALMTLTAFIKRGSPGALGTAIAFYAIGLFNSVTEV